MSLSLQTRLTAFSLYDLRNTIIRFSENEIYEDSTEIESQCRSLGFIFRKELMSFGDSRDTHRRLKD
jgi:hypothetical protein